MVSRLGQTANCRVYWGTHGCMLERGHEGDHLCRCSLDKRGRLLPYMKGGNVGRAPFYGRKTKFYGEDA